MQRRGEKRGDREEEEDDATKDGEGEDGGRRRKRKCIFGVKKKGFMGKIEKRGKKKDLKFRINIMHYNLVIHHGGELKKFPSISYHGGFTTKYPEYSENKISYSGLMSLWSDYGYPNNSYMIGVLLGGNLNHGCLPLNDDHDVLYFLGKQKSCSSVDIVVYILTSEDQSKEDEHEAEGDCEDEGWEATLGKYANILNSHIEGPYDEDIFASFRNENVHDQASGEEFAKEQEPIFEFGNEEFDQNEWNEPPSVGEEFESPCDSDYVVVDYGV
ncbi:hypothetical protein RIF29_27164 [Crotalaria pallida]|uniref:PB1-like domain-containing protein n=1 Tax=Crotalaria pallida TaxID=3830 RepID=A0AAN9ETH6_CROPI